MPGASFRRFEDAMRTSAPERFSEDRDLLHHLITVLPPPLLVSQGLWSNPQSRPCLTGRSALCSSAMTCG